MSRFRLALMIPKRMCSVFHSRGQLAMPKTPPLSFPTSLSSTLAETSILESDAEKQPFPLKALENIRAHAFSEDPESGPSALNSIVSQMLNKGLSRTIEIIEYAQKHYSIRPTPETYILILNALLEAGDWEAFGKWLQQAAANHEFVANPKWGLILDELHSRDALPYNQTIDLAYALTVASYTHSPLIQELAQDCAYKFGDVKAFSIIFSSADDVKNACRMTRIFALRGWDAVIEAISSVQRLEHPRSAMLKLLVWAISNAPNHHALVRVVAYLKFDDFYNYKPAFTSQLLQRHIELPSDSKCCAHFDEHYFLALLLIHHQFSPNCVDGLFAILKDMQQLGVNISQHGLELVLYFTRSIHLRIADEVEKEDILSSLIKVTHAVAPGRQDIRDHFSFLSHTDPTSCLQMFHFLKPSPTAFFHVLSVLHDNKQYKKAAAFFRAKRHILASVDEEWWLSLCAPSYDLAIRIFCNLGDSVEAWQHITELFAHRGTLDPSTRATIIDMECSTCGPKATYPLAARFLDEQFQNGAPSIILGNSVLRVALKTDQAATDHVLGLFESYGLVYTAGTYQHLISASLQARNVSHACALVEEMASRPELRPEASKVLCSVITHCLELQQDLVPSLLKLAALRHLPSSRQLDFLQIRMCIEKSPPELGRVLPLLDAMEHISPPTKTMYEKLLETILSLEEYGLALDIIRRMRLFGTLPSETVYQILIERFKASSINLEKICTMYSIDYPEANLEFLCRQRIKI
ncbi:hypothetical protein DSO57_1008898 [Entomophthora muscae]|uniref:Uncharacterized protein n=1 Tax=Entomophthora muscae TaxID=34485 RepID=A0ACC2TU24_9FUNG|nr:hypothetical protein DSO57_1008898 [Entomophthora muscae]